MDLLAHFAAINHLLHARPPRLCRIRRPLHFYPLKLRGFARLEASVADRQTRSGMPLCLYLSRLLNEL